MNSCWPLSKKLEEKLEALRRLRSLARDDAIAPLRKSLGDRANLVVAEAARIAAEFQISPLTPDLLDAYDRLFNDPVQKDPKCWGKTAILKALTQMDYDQSHPFLRGARHTQAEPVWGGQEDAAAQLRATSILGLVQCTDLGRAEILRHLVDGLADSADPVRIEAVRAIEQMDGEEARLLLRLKARSGDRRPLVTGRVFDALLNLEPDRAIGFVTEHLKSTDIDIRDEATLSLGASRLPEAVTILIETWHQVHDLDFKDVLLRSLSSSRRESAIDFLLDLVRSGLSQDATQALDALRLHDQSEQIQAMVEEARRERE